jgi:hypothetical protein
MINHEEEGSTLSRRSLLTGSAALVAGGLLGGCAMTAHTAKPKTPSAEPIEIISLQAAGMPLIQLFSAYFVRKSAIRGQPCLTK